MRHLIKAIIVGTSILTVQLAFETPASSSDDLQKIIIATKHSNSDKLGARFVLSNTVNLAEIKFLLGLENIPKDVTAVVLEAGKAPRFSKASLEEIDRLFGGDGTHEIEFQNDKDKSKKSIDLELENAKPAEELFSDLSDSAIQPVDGTWQAKVMSIDITDCPAQVKSAVETGNNIPSQNQKITFSKPFSPSSVSQGFGEFTWSKQGENGWASDVLNIDQGGASVKKSMTMVVQSSEQIDFVSRFQLKLPASAVAVLGSGANCQSVVKARYVLLK